MGHILFVSFSVQSRVEVHSLKHAIELFHGHIPNSLRESSLLPTVMKSS